MSGLLLRLRRRHGLSFSLLALLSLVLLACDDEPATPPDLTGLSPAFPEVVADQTIEIEALYTENDDPIEGFRWTIDRGRIDDDGKAKITWHAPDAPGDYRLRVVAIYGTEPGQKAALDSFVRVLPPRREVAPPELQQAEPATSSPRPAAAAGLSRVDKIQKEKRFTAIVEDDFEPFSFERDGKRVGLDVDLVREFARRWLEDPNAVRLLPATTEQRIPILLHGRGDLIAAALTRTPEREEQIDFSTTYFKDGQRLLVENLSKITNVCDLKGRKVAVVRSSTAVEDTVKEARACGFDISSDLVQVQRQEQALDLLMRDEVAAFTSDDIALQNAARGRPFKIVGNHFSEEPYGIGTPKGDERLRGLIDRTLVEMAADGTLAAIYRKWFGDEIRLYPLEASADEDADRTLLAMATSDAPVLMEPVAAPPPPNDYVVQAGDTLSRIAGKVYGDVGPEAWRRIYDANRDAIGADPSALKVGMKLAIPPA